MRRILDSHSMVAIATENHFLGHLLSREGARVYFRRLGDLRDDAVVRRLVAYIYDGDFERSSRLRGCITGRERRQSSTRSRSRQGCTTSR